MSKPASGAAGMSTPAPSSPPASESFFSEFDGTAAGSVLDTSFGDVWEPPADATSLNIVSWKHGVDARVEDGVDKRGFNAISTVLNHPTRKANPLRASRKPLPPLTQPPPILPKPAPTSHYDAYLKGIAPLYETFLQNQQALAASSVAGASELDLQTRNASNLPSLDSIPSMFFDTEFDIANPSTWAAVMEAAESSSKPRDTAVQESLSTHLDNLESHLVHEITLRSSSFFSALSNLQDLNSESSSCLKRISDLKGALSDVGGKQARKGLEIIDAQSRLQSLRVTERGLKRLAELDDFLRIAKGMADGGDWAGALHCVEDVVRWWERNGPSDDDDESSLPLTTLPALANMPTSISILTSNIASQLETALNTVLLSTLTEADNGGKLNKEQFQASVGPMLVGLVRCGKLGTLGGVWRAAVTTSVREGLRQHLPSNDDEDGDKEPRGQTLAQSLQGMDCAQFLVLCQSMYGSMLSRLHYTQEMGDAMSAVLSENSEVTELSIGATTPPVKGEFQPADVLSAACELANTRASKIISVRAEQHTALPLDKFVEMFAESWSFVTATEVLNKRMIVALRGTLASQARGFLVSYHGQRLTRSAKLVEEETWVQVDVPAATQHAVNLIVEAAVSDPGECFIPPKQNASNGEPASSKFITIEDKTFSVVKATAESLKMLADYLSIVINLEVVVTDVISRIIEFLKSFNSRTCQVVLGAGAMRSAGLKNITAKHLALASQSLSAVVGLIPYIREFLRRHLSAKQTVMLIEFDKLKRDYQEHQNEIHAKLVAIMADRLAVHCGELREIDWEATPAKEGPHSYALMLVKETATLHKVLSKYLAQQTVESVMSQVLAASVHRLSEEYTKVEFKSEEAKKRMLQDVAVVVTRLTPLSEMGSTVSQLEQLVREKATPRKPVAAAMRGLLRRNGTVDTSPNSGAVDMPTEDDDLDGDGMTEEIERAKSPVRSIKSPTGSRPGTPLRSASAQWSPSQGPMPLRERSHSNTPPVRSPSPPIFRRPSLMSPPGSPARSLLSPSPGLSRESIERRQSLGAASPRQSIERRLSSPTKLSKQLSRSPVTEPVKSVELASPTKSPSVSPRKPSAELPSPRKSAELPASPRKSAELPASPRKSAELPSSPAKSTESLPAKAQAPESSSPASPSPPPPVQKDVGEKPEEDAEKDADDAGKPAAPAADKPSTPVNGDASDATRSPPSPPPKNTP